MKNLSKKIVLIVLIALALCCITSCDEDYDIKDHCYVIILDTVKITTNSEGLFYGECDLLREGPKDATGLLIIFGDTGLKKITYYYFDKRAAFIGEKSTEYEIYIGLKVGGNKNNYGYNQLTDNQVEKNYRWWTYYEANNLIDF